MAGIQDDVIATFLQRLSENADISAATVDGLRSLLEGEDVPKPDAITGVIVDGSGDLLN